MKYRNKFLKYYFTINQKQKIMKKFILPLLSVLVLTACSSKKSSDLENTKQIVLTAPAVANADTMVTNEVAENNKPEPKQIINNYYAAPKQTNLPKKKVQQPPVVINTPAPVQPEVIAPVVTAPSTNSGTDVATNGAGNVPEAAPVEVKKKKGISDAGKGAIIGGVGGAVAGAVIGKNGKGAAVGAVIGAAGGYILGRKSDKKSGRIDMTNN